ncbi:uncharacterized protein LOC131597607 [Vicia villosa]|uniref:uncharacterized protein LOC131597607 n=1 Tax=Vicia villosa TaxID=3911 RepID=UPI00273CF295|nr:uncharacterized protein LOC131597607 [Vicia villosa]
MQIKGQWNKNNPHVYKLVECYKQAVSTQQSGSSESNIMQGEKFTFEAAWRLLKYESKWLAGSSEASTKRRKNSASGAYSSSSNALTPTSSEYDPSSPILSRRLIGQKTAKRKEKEKIVEMSFTPNLKYGFLKDGLQKNIDLMSMFAHDYACIEGEKLEIERKKVDAKIKKAEIAEERLNMNDMQILSKDTSNMDTRKLQAHEILCDMIREKYEINEYDYYFVLN